MPYTWLLKGVSNKGQHGRVLQNFPEKEATKKRCGGTKHQLPFWGFSVSTGPPSIFACSHFCLASPPKDNHQFYSLLTGEEPLMSQFIFLPLYVTMSSGSVKCAHNCSLNEGRVQSLLWNWWMREKEIWMLDECQGKWSYSTVHVPFPSKQKEKWR